MILKACRHYRKVCGSINFGWDCRLMDIEDRSDMGPEEYCRPLFSDVSCECAMHSKLHGLLLGLPSYQSLG